METVVDLDRTQDAPAKPSRPVLEPPEYIEISIDRLFDILLREKRKIFRTVLVAAAVAIPVVFLLPVEYRSEAVILTPQPAQSSLSAMAQLSGIGQGLSLPALGLLSGFAVRNPADLYIGILESRTIADRLIDRFKLKQVYGTKYRVTARKLLERNTTIKSGKDSLIHIRVEDKDPNRAAALANAYVDELSKQNSRSTLTEASQRRRFFEEELVKEKDQLASAEVGLRNTQQATGLVLPIGQAEALIRSGALLRVEIITRQAELEAMKTYASDENPRLQVLKRELSAMQGELARVERGNNAAGALDLATGQLPQAGLESTLKVRDLKYHETLFEILAKQYEAARLDEAKSAPLVQVIDEAVVPEKRSWPPRTILTLAVILLTALVSCLHTVMRARTLH